MSNEQPSFQPLALDSNQQIALTISIQAYLENHPYYSLDEQGNIDWSLYDTQTVAQLNTFIPLLQLLQQYPTPRQILTIHDSSVLSHVQAAARAYLEIATQEEIEQFDAGQRQEPDDHVAILRRLYADIARRTPTADHIEPTTALSLGIPALISYETIWKYAKSDPEKEQDPAWAQLQRQALHLLHLRALEEDVTDKAKQETEEDI